MLLCLSYPFLSFSDLLLSFPFLSFSFFSLAMGEGQGSKYTVDGEDEFKEETDRGPESLRGGRAWHGGLFKKDAGAEFTNRKEQVNARLSGE